MKCGSRTAQNKFSRYARKFELKWLNYTGEKPNEIEVDNTMKMLSHGSEYLCHQRPRGETHGINKKQCF